MSSTQRFLWKWYFDIVAKDLANIAKNKHCLEMT